MSRDRLNWREDISRDRLNSNELRPKTTGRATQGGKCEGLSRQRLKGSVLINVRLIGAGYKSSPSYDLFKSVEILSRESPEAMDSLPS